MPRRYQIMQRREHGGPVLKDESYIVGEKRAEVFTPNVDGYILPKVPGAGGDGAGRHTGRDPQPHPSLPLLDDIRTPGDDPSELVSWPRNYLRIIAAAVDEGGRYDGQRAGRD